VEVGMEDELLGRRGDGHLAYNRRREGGD